jgi:oligopeptide/dipeptide ABC transporter ATP-binding protein
MGRPLLAVENLKTHFHMKEGLVPAVDDVSFVVHRSESVGLVGESGCGKSVTSLSILRLIPEPPGRIASGKVLLEGEDLLAKSTQEMRQIRGNKISMVFQEPMSSLNPVLTVGRQISEVFELHQGLDPKRARDKVVESLRMVGIPSPERRCREYPHQLSGGMRQRVMIAMALACRPKLLIADEPTTALDVTIQAQILDILKELKAELGMSILMITHDLGIIAEISERIIIMYAGKIVEEAPARRLFDSPQHPYTQGLLASIPSRNEHRGLLATIPGSVPRPTQFPKGCRFHPRCLHARSACKVREPPLLEMEVGSRVRCWLYA